MSQQGNLPLLKTGWLKKKGKHNSSNWKKRYFAIVGGLMWRYDKPPPSDKHVPSKGEIKLYNCKVSVDSGKRKFTVEDYMGKSHIFKAESVEELNAWVAAIQQASSINPSVRYNTMSMASIPLPSQTSHSTGTANRASLTHSGSHQQVRATPPPEMNRVLSQSTGAIPQQQQRSSTNANIAPVVFVANPPIYQQPSQQGPYPTSIRLSQNAQYNPYAIPQAYAPHLQAQQYQGQPTYQYQQQGQQYVLAPGYQQPQYVQQGYAPQSPQQMQPQVQPQQGQPQQYAPPPQQYQQPAQSPQYVQSPQVPTAYQAPSPQPQYTPQTPPPQNQQLSPNTVQTPQPTTPGPQTPSLYPSTPEPSPGAPSKPLPPKHRPPSSPLPPPPTKAAAPPTNPAFNSSYPELFTYYALGNGFGAPSSAPRRPSQPPPFEAVDQTSSAELELIQARMEQQKRSVEEQRIRRQIELELLKEETERLRKQEEEERQKFEHEQQRLRQEQERLQKNLQSYQTNSQPSAPGHESNGEVSPRGELTAAQKKEIEEHQKKIQEAQRRIEQEYQKILELEQGQQILQQHELQLKHEEQLDKQNEASNESHHEELAKNDSAEELAKDIHTLKIDSDFKQQLESQLRKEIKAKLHRTLSTAAIVMPKAPEHEQQQNGSSIPSAPYEPPVPAFAPESVPQPAFDGPPKYSYNSYFSQT